MVCLKKSQISLNVLGLISSIIYLIWLIQSGSGGTSLNSYLIGHFLAFFFLIIAFSLPNLAHSKQIRWIIIWAILFRLLGLFTAPILEDDHFRYLWDGYQFVSTGSPYGSSPADFFTDNATPQAMQEVLDNINYPQVPTIYGPVNQWIFGLSYLLSPASVLTLKCLILSFEIAGLLLLKVFTNNKYFILYAWNPLIIKEVSFTGHHDAIGIFFLILALYAYQHKNSYVVAISLGLAVAGKVIALLITPLMLIRFKPYFSLIFFLTLGICYLPFIFINGASDLLGFFTFAKQWEFNSSLFSILKLALDSATIKLFSFCILLFGLIKLLSIKKDQIPRGDILFGLLFLLSPVVNPWYLIWLLPFALIHPSRSAWVASLTLPLSYITGLNMNTAELYAYNQPLWAKLIEYIPIIIMLLYDIKYPLKNDKQ